MLHEKKRQSLLSWVQSAGGRDVEKLADLADGKLLSQLVITLSDQDFNLSGNSADNPAQPDLNNDSKEVIVENKEPDLTQEVTESSAKENESNTEEQGIVNGYHEPVNDDFKSNGVIDHTEEVRTEDPSENAVTNDDNSILLTREDEDTTDYVINGIINEESPPLVKTDQVESATNSDLCETSGCLKTDDAPEVIDSIDGATSEIQRNYDVVQKFIENMLELDVPDLVVIPHCMEGHELELAKLTVLLLSSMVQYSISTQKDHVMESCYSLPSEAQEEIQDSLELFLKERQSPVELKEFHLRLSRCTKLRISPRKQPSTPQPQKLTKRGRKRKSFAVVEFQESPIKNFIKSPDIRHVTPNSEARLREAVRCKDKTIAMLTYDLDVEKYNVDDLRKQKEDLCLQLSKLKKEKEMLRKELEEVQAHLENNETAFEKAKKEWKNTTKSLHNQIKDLQQAEQFWKENCQIEHAQKIEKPEFNEEREALKCAMKVKDDKIQELKKQIEFLTVSVEKVSRDREDLERKLQENYSDTEKIPKSPQNKCFNVSDLHLRNELKDRCKQLEKELSMTKMERNDAMQQLHESARNREREEKEYRARLRKADKDRDDAISKQKKLEIENSNLKGQIEVFKKVLPNTPSTPTPSSTNRRSSRTRNACDTEKIGLLWSTYDDESPKGKKDASCEPIKPACVSVSSQTEKIKDSDISPPNRLCQSQSVTTSDIGDSISACRLCFQIDFSEVPPLIQNLCKILREEMVLCSDELLELHRYERDFLLPDLVSVLLLLTRVLMNNRARAGPSPKSLKRKRVPDGCESDINSTNKPEQQIVDGGQHPVSDGAVANGNANDVLKYQQLYEAEKKKVAIYQAKLKDARNLLAWKEEQLTNLQAELTKSAHLRDTDMERLRNVTNKYELIKKELTELKKSIEEKPEPIIETVVETIPPPPCVSCPVLKKKILNYRLAKKDSDKKIASLNDFVKMKATEIEELKKEMCLLYKKKKELEETLRDPTIVSSGVYSPSLKSIREKLKEAKYADMANADGSDGSQEESEAQNASSVTNCSFAVPSAEEFASCSRNPTQLRAFCKVEDEAEMLSQSSIIDIQSDTPSDRLHEINRRNTLCLPHLKSQYPLELNMTPSQHKYFQPPPKKQKISKEKFCSSFASLISKSGAKVPSSTPKVKKSFTHGMHKTNTSAARLQFRRSSSKSSM